MRLLYLGFIALAVASLTGCTNGSRSPSRIFKTRPDFAKIDVGMTKTQVIALLGDPEENKAQSGVSYIVYWDSVTSGFTVDKYFVRFVDGKVESFGSMGDFDSTKDPTLNINIKSR
jgi:hypothetical protein